MKLLEDNHDAAEVLHSAWDFAQSRGMDPLALDLVAHYYHEYTDYEAALADLPLDLERENRYQRLKAGYRVAASARLLAMGIIV